MQVYTYLGRFTAGLLSFALAFILCRREAVAVGDLCETRVSCDSYGMQMESRHYLADKAHLSHY